MNSEKITFKNMFFIIIINVTGINLTKIGQARILLNEKFLTKFNTHL